MSITDPLDDELALLGSAFAVQVIAPREVAHGLLRRIRADRRRWPGSRSDGPAAPIVTLPGGALLRLDDVPTRADTRGAIAELIRRVLEDADLDGDSVVLHRVDGLADLDDCPRAVVLRLFPPPSQRGRPLPPTWIDVAAEWVFGDLPPDATVRLRVLGVELEVRGADAAGILHGCASAGAWCDVVTGDVTDRVRTASISFGSAPHVAIGGGGPGCDDAGLLARFDLLVDVATELADWCAYACLDFEDGFDQLALGLATSAWTAAGHAPANRVVGELGDQAVPDAYPFQVVGPRHRARLADAGITIEWDQIVDDHRTLSIGDPTDWLPGSRHRDELQSEGWTLLAPLLLDSDDLGSPAAADTDDDEELLSSVGLPDLADIVIEPQPHPRRGTRLTPLELASWMSGEPHGDHPSVITPVLQSLLRNLAFGLDPERRQALKDLVPAAVQSQRPADDELAAGIVDWLVGVQARSWLDAAGLEGVAERLSDVSGTTTGDGARRAVALLGDALVTAHRRLEITTAIAGEHAATVDSIAWSAWERAAEASGWSAASDAATTGLPPDLSAEVDRRLVDMSLDRAGGNDDAAGADTMWTAAFEQLGTLAWRRAWDRAEEQIFHESAFSLRTTVRASLDDLVGVDGDGLDGDLAVDAVDRAASAALARRCLHPDGHDPFDMAREAEQGPAGVAWRQALEQARQVIGTAPFDEAIDGARAEIDRWLATGPPMVTRLTTVALAREAAGVAARAVAARVAAERLAQGATVDEAEAAADTALAPVADRLATDAVSLARQLCGSSAAATDRSAAIA